MSGDQGMNMLYLVLCMVLVGSALIGMRLPIGKALKMLLAWVAIFGVAFALFTFRSEFSAFGARLKAEATGTPIETGELLRIAMRDDGHFWVNASVNGQQALFLVDSGASITTVSPAVAAAAKVETGMRVAQVETANGAVQAPDKIIVDYVDGPLKYLHNEWSFSPAANGGTDLGFAVDFAFKSRLFEALAGQMFDRALRRMTSAFEQRANALYGISKSSAQSAA